MAQKFLNGVLVTGDAPSTFTSTTTMDFNLVANPPELNFEDTSSTSGTKRARWTLDSNIFSADALSNDDQSVTHNLLDFNLSSGHATFGGNISANGLSATSGSFTEGVTIADVIDDPFTALRLMNQKTYGSGTGTNEKVRFVMGISESGISFTGREGFAIELGIGSEGDSSDGVVEFKVRDGGVLGTYSTVTGSNKSVSFVGNLTANNLSGTNTGDQTLPTDFVSAANGGTFLGDITVDSTHFTFKDGSPEFYFHTEGNHYNWLLAAQENVDGGFEIGHSSATATALDQVASNYTRALTLHPTTGATFAGTITAAGGSTNNTDDANILTLTASEHARLLVDTSSTDGHRATLALESNGNELTLGTTGSASYLDPVGELTISGQVIFPSAATTKPVLPNGFISRNDNTDTSGKHDIWGISERYYPSNSTTADAWGIQWSGTPNDIVFVGGGADVFTVSLDEGNITALGNVTADYGYFNAESLSQDLRVGGIHANLGLYIADTYDMQFDLGNSTSAWKFSLTNVQKFGISSSGDGVFAGKLGVGGKTPAYGLTLAQGTGVNNKIAWTDATPSFRASMWANSSDDKFKIATGNASSEETVALEIDTSQKVTFKGGVQIDGSLTGVGAFVPSGGGAFTGNVQVNATGSVYPFQTSSPQRYNIQILNSNNTVNTGYGWWLATDTDFDFALHADGAGDRFTLTRSGDGTFHNNLYASSIIATEAFRVGATNKWKIRGNSSNNNLAFEYAASETLADANIKLELSSTTATFSNAVKIHKDSIDGLKISRTSGESENIHIGAQAGTNLTALTHPGIIKFHGCNQAEIYTQGAQPLVLGTSATPRLTIVGGGNIGIGTSTPHGQLQFDNGVNTRKIVLYEGVDNDYQFYGFGLESSTLVYSTYSSGDDHVFFVGASATSRNELMRVKSTGDVVVANDVFSDGLYVNSSSAVSGTQVAIVKDGSQNLQRWGTANSGAASYRFRIDQDMKFIANSGSGDNLTIFSDTGNLTTSGAISASNVSGTNTGDGADSYLAGDEVFAAHEHEEVNADTGINYKRMAKVTISKPGTATIKFEAYIQSGTYYWSYVIARNNGTNVDLAAPLNQLVSHAFTQGLASGVNSAVHVYTQYDLDVAGLVGGDQVELWMRSSTAGGGQVSGNGQKLYAKKFRMSSVAPTVESNAFLHGTTTISHVAEDERYGGESWSKYLTFDAAHSGGGGMIWSRQGTSYNRGILSNHGDLQIIRTQGDSNQTTGIKDLVILNDGKVGISNATPAARLTIGSAQGKTLDFSYSTNNGYINNISNYWNSSTDTRMDFNVGNTANTAPTTIMSVGYGGNVGVKIIAPLKPLHVYAPDAGGNIRLTRTGTSEYHDISPYYSYTNGNSADFGTTSVHKTFLTTNTYNALEINSDQEVSLLGYRGADGFALPQDENTGYSNFSAGGFGVLFREARDNYILGNAYYYKTGGVPNWRAKHGSDAASMIAQDEGGWNFQTAPASTTSPHLLNFTANRFVIKNTGNVGVNAATPRNKLTVFTDGSAEEEIALRLINPIGFDNAGSGASIIFGQDRSQAENYEMAKIRSTQVSGGSSVNGGLIFSTRDANTMTDRLTIGSDGNIVASLNEDKSFEFGTAHVGYMGHADYAGFSHIDKNSTSTYALLQGADGTTYLNTPTNIRIRSANVDKQMFKGEYFGLGNTNPRFFLHSNQDVSSLDNTSRYLTFSGTGAFEIPWANNKQAIVYSANDNGTTAQPRNIGVLLHSDSTTDNTFTPLLGFGAKSDSGNFSQVVAGIAGKRLAYAGDTNWSGGELWFWTGRSDTIDGSAQGLPQARPAMIMTSTRQVAIGTTSPAAGVKLDVQAEALFTSLSLKNNRINSGYGDDSEDSDIWINYEGYLNGNTRYRDFRVGNGRNGQIMMCDGSTSKVAINMNASTSTARLHVLNNGGNGGGGAVDHGILAEATSGQASIGAFHAGDGYANLNLGSNDGATHWHISKRLSADSHRLEYYYYAGGNHVSRYIFQANGDFHADGDVIAYSTTASDQKLKDNVEIIDNALDKVCKLNGVSFTWNSGSRKGQKDLGVIAQNVEKVLPELVREKESPYHDDQTIKTVDYEKLTAVLIESVKELKVEIEELKKQIK